MRRLCIMIVLLLITLVGCSTNAFDEAMRAGEDAFALGDYEVAVASFEEAVALEPDNMQAVIALDGAKHRVEDQRWNSTVNSITKEVDRLREFASAWNNLSQKATAGEISHNTAINRMKAVLVPRMSEISVRLIDMRDDIIDELGVAGEVFCVALNDVTAMLSDVVHVVDNSELAKADSFAAYPEIRALLLMQDKLKGIQDVYGDLTDYKSINIIRGNDRYLLAGVQSSYCGGHMYYPTPIDWYVVDLEQEKVQRIYGDYRSLIEVKDNVVRAFHDGYYADTYSFRFPQYFLYDLGAAEYKKETYWDAGALRGHTLGHAHIEPLKLEGIRLQDGVLVFMYNLTDDTMLLGGGPVPHVRIEDTTGGIVLDIYNIEVSEETVNKLESLAGNEYFAEIKAHRFVDVNNINHMQVKLIWNDKVEYTCTLQKGDNEYVPDFCVKLKHR